MKHNPKLRPGDLGAISEILGLSVRTVQGTYYGYRANKRVLRTIDRYVKLREEMEEELKKELSPTFRNGQFQ